MTLDQLIRTQWVALAARKARENPDISVEATDRFLSQYEIEGVPANEVQPISLALSKARREASEGYGITREVDGLIRQYSEIHDRNYNQTSLADIRQWITRDSRLASLPQGFERYIWRNSRMTYQVLRDAAQQGEENSDAQQAVFALALLERYKFEELALEMERQLTERRLNSIYTQQGNRDRSN